jgi:hypothetical protein
MELRELRQLAAKFELPMNFIYKDLKLSEALYQLQDVDGIVLKGGTAINRVYLKSKEKMRFSEDIDFDLQGNDVKRSVKITDVIVKKLDGFEPAKARIMHSTIRYDMYYTTPLGNRDKIRLEFKIGKINEKHLKQIVNFGFVPYDSALLNVYDKEVLIRHKVDCVLNRREGKDWYDLYHIADEIKTNKKKKFLENLRLDKKEIKYISNSTNPYIPRKNRPDWLLILEELKNRVK